jgi:uncharacterized membrane protein
MSEEVNVEEMEPGKPEVTDNDRMWALLGYIVPIIALIALLLEEQKARPFIRYHAVQALMIGAITLVLSLTACGWIIPWVYGIYLGIQAYQGKWVEIPALTDFAKEQGWIES